MEPLDAALTLLPDNRAEVTLMEAREVAPGQAAVFYDGDRLLGGGGLRAPNAVGLTLMAHACRVAAGMPLDPQPHWS